MVYGTYNELVTGANLDQLTSLGGPHCSYVSLLKTGIPSGKHTKNLWKITIFNGNIHYNWPCSIATLT